MIETGISFGKVHSYYDLNLVLSKVNIPPALPKTNYVDLPGGNGSLDLTEAHGEVKFEDRDCEFTFSVHPSETMTFEEKKTEVSNALNGRQCDITLDKDEDFYYSGRCTVNEYLQDKRLLQIVVTAKVKPYKMKQTETVVSFDLSAEPKEVILMNRRKSVVPEITCTHDNTVVVFGGVTYSLAAGTYKVLDIFLKEGSNELKVSGEGTIEFRYREGEL